MVSRALTLLMGLLSGMTSRHLITSKIYREGSTKQEYWSISHFTRKKASRELLETSVTTNKALPLDWLQTKGRSDSMGLP